MELYPLQKRDLHSIHYMSVYTLVVYTINDTATYINIEAEVSVYVTDIRLKVCSFWAASCISAYGGSIAIKNEQKNSPDSQYGPQLPLLFHSFLLHQSTMIALYAALDPKLHTKNGLNVRVNTCFASCIIEWFNRRRCCPLCGTEVQTRRFSLCGEASSLPHQARVINATQ